MSNGAVGFCDTSLSNQPVNAKLTGARKYQGKEDR
jgi:hypothetical protein